VARPHIGRMNKPRRFEIQLPAERRAELDSLADEIGTNAADLARLAIIRLLANRNELLGRREVAASTEYAA
jgi:hypothetical protein